MLISIFNNRRLKERHCIRLHNVHVTPRFSPKLLSFFLLSIAAELSLPFPPIVY